MTIETTSSFNLTADQLILNALIILKIYGPNDTLQAGDETLGMTFLNLLVKHWEGLGIHVWCTRYANIFLQYNQNSYSLGSNSTDAMWAEVFNETSLVSSTSTTLTVMSPISVTSGDNVGVQGSDSRLYWGIANGTTTASTTVTVPTSSFNFPSGITILSGSYVYTFTSRPIKPLQINSAIRRSSLLTSISDIIMPSISFYDYQQLTNKFSQGTPLQWKYRPNTGSGTFVVWPTPVDLTQRIHIQYLRPLFDFTVGSDNPDIPQEWLLTLTYGLAAIMAPAYGKIASAAPLMQIAETMLQGMDGYDVEKTSLYFEPSKYRY